MADWESCSVAGLCDTGLAELQTGPFGTQLHAHDYIPDGIPVVPTEAIRDRQIDRSVLPRISSAKAKELGRHKLKRGDILFARRGAQATGHIGYVREAEAGFICGTGAILLRVAEENLKVTPEFLSHVFANPAAIRWFKFHAIGATMPNLNEGIIRAFQFHLPPIDEQKAIAHLLSAFDDKIEMNRLMNETLESITRATFADWFVNFGPVQAKKDGHRLHLSSELAALFPDQLNESGKPPGWRTATVADVAVLIKGSVAPSASPTELFEHYSIPAYDADQLPVVEAGASILSNKTEVPAEAILLSKLNPEIARIWLVPERRSFRAVCSTEFLPFRPKVGVGRAFVHQLFWSKSVREILESRVTGTSKSHQRVKPDSILNIQVQLPPTEILSAFEALVWPLLSRSLSNREESRTLASFRDFLLPKLMSREIRLRDAEKLAEKVA